MLLIYFIRTFRIINHVRLPSLDSGLKRNEDLRSFV